MNGETGDVEKECERYSALLQKNPVDIVCLGIGENGHIAFNDPGVADFNDEKWVKPVELELPSRQQQVNNGCFPHLNEVPLIAITLTIPALLKPDYLFCIVPAQSKAEAVYRTLNGEISEACPATILRRKKNVILYLDNNSSNLLDENMLQQR
jgi:glucosamine-6-phosphate deaminase